MHVYACLLLCYMSMFASPVLGFAMLSVLRGLDLVWLQPTHMWLWLGVTICEMHLRDVDLLYAYLFLTPCDDMLALLACNPIGFLCFYASLHGCLHVHEWVLLAYVIKLSSYYLVRIHTRLWYMRPRVPSGTLLDGTHMLSILQHNGTMDTRSKPTFVLLGHHLLFDNMFACPSVCLACLFAPVWPFLLVCSFHAFYLSFYLLCFFLYLSASLFPCLLHVQALSKGHLERRKQKGQRCNHEDISPKREIFSRLEA